jgi:hypothetical protein
MLVTSLPRVKKPPRRTEREARASELFDRLLSARRRDNIPEARHLTAGLAELGYIVEPVADIGLKMVPVGPRRIRLS